LFATRGDIERLWAGGGAIEAVSRVLVGDGCGCLASPAWSPDGSKIAYLDGYFSTYTGTYNGIEAAVAVMNPDGSGRHDLKRTKAYYDGLSWSPDSKRIAYVDNSGKIAIVNVDGSGSVTLVPGYDPAWSPTGSKIAYATVDQKNPAIYVMNPDGSGVQKLTSLAGHEDGQGDRFGMAWSPDGTRIAFSSLNDKLEVMNADGTNAHALGNNASYNKPAWSPAGSQIVFSNNKGLAVIGADGTGLHQLTHGSQGTYSGALDFEPTWSPDGKTIVFASDRDDPYSNAGMYNDRSYDELYEVNANGSNLHALSFTKPSKWVNQATFNSANGRPLATLPGRPTLAGKIAAIGKVLSSGTDQISLYNAHTGSPLAVVSAGRGTRFSLVGANKHWVVFRAGHSISALNTQTHKILRLAKEPTHPLDLSVSGRRIAWAENPNGHGRILSLELPS
jgi:TolB protein